MGSRENNSGGKKKKSSGGITGVIAAVLGLNLIKAAGDSGAVIAVVLIAAVLIFFTVWILNAAKKKKAGREEKAYFQTRWSRDNAEVPITKPAQRPEASVYDENITKMGIEADWVRRFAQLDSFLKNGIIDKNEYNVLREKYKKEMR